MKQIALFLFLLAFNATTLVAQVQYDDQVTLKDGSIIRGAVIEHFVGKHVKIMTLDGTTHQFPSDQVAEVSMDGHTEVKKSFESQERGYYHISTIGILGGEQNQTTRASFSYNMVNGYQLNKHWSFGVGTGLEYLDHIYFPIYADARYFLNKKNFSPFISGQAGYSIPFGGVGSGDRWNEYYGGWLWGAEFGVRSYSSEHVGFVFGLGFRRQNLRLDQTFDPWGFDIGNVSQFHQLNRVSMRIGLLFN